MDRSPRPRSGSPSPFPLPLAVRANRRRAVRPRRLRVAMAPRAKGWKWFGPPQAAGPAGSVGPHYSGVGLLPLARAPTAMRGQDAPIALLVVGDRHLEAVRIGDREGHRSPRQRLRPLVELDPGRFGTLGLGRDVLFGADPQAEPGTLDPVTTLGEIIATDPQLGVAGLQGYVLKVAVGLVLVRDLEAESLRVEPNAPLQVAGRNVWDQALGVQCCGCHVILSVGEGLLRCDKVSPATPIGRGRMSAARLSGRAGAAGRSASACRRWPTSAT